MLLHHFPVNLFTLPDKVRIAHLLDAESAGMVLLPDQQAVLIAKIKETFVIRIMAGSNRIGIHVLDQLQVTNHQGHRQCRPGHRVILMPVEAAQDNRFPVQ
ncbi:hypothetical protein D3C75_936370 [compost metagenome]